MSAAKDKIVQEAKDRLKRCLEWESMARKNFIDDYKFANADAENGYQWPDTIRRARQIDQRPALTVNKTRQHCLQIINDARENKAAIRISAVGDGATKESADVFEGVVRHIEYISNAQDAYDTATSFQVQAGVGYWRVVTDYPDDKTFDQEIYIRRVKDPLTVVLDPDCNESDKSDARYGFIFEDLPRDLAEKRYAAYKDKMTGGALGSSDAWNTKDTVRVCEYYRKIQKADKLYSLPPEYPGAPETGSVRGSKLPPELKATLVDDPSIQSRDILTDEVEWYLIIGDEIAETRQWLGKYIPIVCVIGEETVIDGQLDRKGHTRALVDPQRMYNYWTSSAVEFVALQGKTPWVASQRAVEGLEDQWRRANLDNLAFLPYKDIDDQGQPIQPPTKPPPPQMAPAYMQGMQIAAGELQSVSGQYDAQMGQESNERSGISITNRQRQGDKATYHYIDNLAKAIRFTGRILIDLIPKIYDTPRVIRILAEDGEDDTIQINPGQQQALQVQQPTQPMPQSAAGNPQQQHVQRIFNPAVGKYDVVADVGPAFATRRQEAFNALTQIATQAPELMNVIGDLVFKAADFPMAEELAERLRNMLPPQALGGPNPEQVAMQQQMQQMQQAMEKVVQTLADERARRTTEEQQKAIDVYKAQTSRLDVLKDIAPESLLPLIGPVIHDAVRQHLSAVLAAGNPTLETAAQQ
ncbi:MAG TPA: portal protein [Rhodopila sp.]|nr:portal protein [Rhodopila sp.]